jgi:hypothetical protein
VRTSDHLGGNWSSAVRPLNDGGGPTLTARNLTRSALIVIDVMKGKSSGIKNGDVLDLRGMSSANLSKFLQKLAKSGFKGKIVNEN